MHETSKEDPAVESEIRHCHERGGDNERRSRPVTRVFDRFASIATRWAGSPHAFGCAVLAVIVWLILGPIFHYSDAWQLVVNTGTTIVTFLMVFLLQQSQNKDSVAMHLKLDELLSSQRAANNALIGIENASEDDLRRLAAAYLALGSRHKAGEEDPHDIPAAGDEGEARRDARREAQRADSADA
jgi:low affinity Fe/Cu permease